MKKGFIAGVVLIAVFVIVYLVYQKEPEPAENQGQSVPVATTPASDLPSLALTKLDGTQLMANSLQGKTVLFFFQPDCDHCQRETVQIQQNLSAFRDYKVYFVSDAPQPALAKFAQEYKLAFEPNFVFAQASLENILNTVGPMASPSMFVYAENGRLVKSFKGETPIEQILPFM